MPHIIDADGCETEARSCSVCGGEAGLLGQLGNRKHFTCRDCGMEFSVLATDPEQQPEIEAP